MIAWVFCQLRTEKQVSLTDIDVLETVLRYTICLDEIVTITKDHEIILTWYDGSQSCSCESPVDDAHNLISIQHLLLKLWSNTWHLSNLAHCNICIRSTSYYN